MALYQEVETQMPGEDKDETEDASSDSELDHTQCLLGRESRSEKSNIAWPQHRRERRSQMSQLVVQILILVLLAYIAVISTIETFTGLEKSPRLQQNKDPKYPKLPNCKSLVSELSFSSLTRIILAPANMAVKYEYQKLGKDPYSKWYGPPSDGVDAAWDALLEAMNIRATKEEFEVQSENFTDIVQMADGDYLGIIGVWHQIHCLDVMRRAFHLDYYQPDLGDGETEVYNTNHYGEYESQSSLPQPLRNFRSLH